MFRMVKRMAPASVIIVIRQSAKSRGRSTQVPYCRKPFSTYINSPKMHAISVFMGHKTKERSGISTVDIFHEQSILAFFDVFIYSIYLSLKGTV